MKNSDFDRAILDYDRIIAIDPKNSEFYNRRGSAYEKKNEDVRAIADFDKAVILDPKNVIALYNRAMFNLRRNRMDLAIMDFNNAVEVDPKYIDAYVNRGDAYFMKGMKDTPLRITSKPSPLIQKTLLPTATGALYFTIAAIWIARSQTMTAL